MENSTHPLERTATDLRSYTTLRLRQLKLRLIDRCAGALNAVFWVLVTVILLSFTLFFGAGAAVWALSLWTGSLLWALLIMTGGFLLATIIVWICRKGLIVNLIVRGLSGIFFEEDGFKGKEVGDE